MEIRRWLCCVVNCALLCCIAAKPFSLNDLIEAESQQKAVVHTALSPKLEEVESTAEHFSLNKGLKPLNRISKKFKERGAILNLIPLSKKISPLKYRKTFQIKSPLKPKRVKQSLRTRHKRKNQSVKSEIDGNAILNQKYIPLLRSLGMLFDNILGPDSGESLEIPKGKRKRIRYYFEDDDAPCKCPHGESNADSKSKKKTIVSAEAVSIEISVTTEAPTAAADNTPSGNLRSIRWNKNVPILLARNTISSGRNDHGFGERSRAAHNGSNQGYISRVNGNSEHNPEWGQDKSNAQSDEKHTGSDSRNGASSVQIRGTIRGGGSSENNTEDIETGYENDAISKDEAENLLDGPRGHINEFYGQDKLKNRRNEAESTTLLPESVREQQRLLSEGEVTESIQPKEDDEEGYLGVTHNSSDDQRIFVRHGTPASEDQKADTRHETLNARHKSINEATEEEQPLYDPTKPNKTSRNGPVVVIIDGYSVTRHKNGENKLAEKAIRIRP